MDMPFFLKRIFRNTKKRQVYLQNMFRNPCRHSLDLRNKITPIKKTTASTDCGSEGGFI